MGSTPKLSLCIPTEGVLKWVSPALDSIYSQQCDKSLFEVVVTDNGTSNELQMAMREFSKCHDNFLYERTNAPGFTNQLEAFKRARGTYIKFVNSRAVLRPGSIEYLLDFVAENEEEAPVAYFINGVLPIEGEVLLDSFDDFVRTLSHFSSWSGGIGVWKKQLDDTSIDLNSYNQMFPHLAILFGARHSSKYLIDNNVLMDWTPCEDIEKHGYNVFHTFAVEYVDILKELLDSGDISNKTYETVKKGLLGFLIDQYVRYCIQGIPCPHDLSGISDSMKVHFGGTNIKLLAYRRFVSQNVRKLI